MIRLGQHRRAPRPHLLSDWAEDWISAAVVLIFMIGVFALFGLIPKRTIEDHIPHIHIIAGEEVQ